MRIAILTNDFPPRATGGAGIIAELYAKELEKRGHEIMVEVVEPGLRDRGAFSRLFFHIRDLGTRKEIVERILAWKPDTLLTHNLTGCGFSTPRRIKAEGIPWIHVLHDVQLIDPSGKIVNGFSPFAAGWRYFWSRARRKRLGHPTGVVSPTEWLLKFHREWMFFWSSKTKVIPNPVVVEQGESPCAPTRRDTLFVGRMDRDKGVDVLLDAWKLLGDARPRLHIVGAGMEEGRVRELHDGRITIHGPQSHDRVLQLMRECRVLVVPSLILENQPTVILEALAAGCAVVASDVGGIPETLGDAGWIIPAGDAKALSIALGDATKDGAIDEKRTKAREDILAVHRMDVAVGSLERFLKEVA